MKTLIALFLAVAASSAIAANDVQADRTGVPSDVAKIISITDTRFACGIVPVELVYQDSLGVRRVATYMVEGAGARQIKQQPTMMVSVRPTQLY